MGFKISLGEDKGIDCDVSSSEGIVSANCKRTIKQRDGSVVSDGQEVHLMADPSNDCNIAYTGHIAAMDDDGFRTFDPLAKRLQKSCKRQARKGLIAPGQKPGA